MGSPEGQASKWRLMLQARSECHPPLRATALLQPGSAAGATMQQLGAQTAPRPLCRTSFRRSSYRTPPLTSWLSTPPPSRARTNTTVD